MKEEVGFLVHSLFDMLVSFELLAKVVVVVTIFVIIRNMFLILLNRKRGREKEREREKKKNGMGPLVGGSALL